MEMRFRGRRQDNGEIVSSKVISAYYPDAKYGLLMGSAWVSEEEGEFPVDLELITGFKNADGNDLYEHDTIMVDQEPHSVVWSGAKGLWVAETDNSEVPLFEVATNSTDAVEIHAADCRYFACVESLL